MSDKHLEKLTELSQQTINVNINSLLAWYNHCVRYVVGVDEAGRGPLAGPVAVGAALVSEDFNWDLLPGVTDSKKLTEKKREEIFTLAKKLQREGQLHFAVSMVSASVIDRIGIVAAINVAIARILSRISPEVKPRGVPLGLTSGECVVDQVEVRLDGGLKAPSRFVNQVTIIKGDQKERMIGLASIVAKVTRDRYMVRVARKPEFSVYNFHIHKGYGTKEHRKLITDYGISALHRATFCGNISVPL